MSRRPPNADQLEILRDTFRRQPPSTPKHFRAAGLLAGVTEAAARRAFERGWAPAITPIQTQLDDERARQQQSAELLKVDRMVTSMKTGALVLQNEMRRLAPAVKALTDNLLEHADAGDLGRLPHEVAVKTMQRLVKVHKDVAAISAKAIELDRLVAGEATSIIGHKALDSEPVDLMQAKSVSDALARALERANAKADDEKKGSADGDTDTAVN